MRTKEIVERLQKELAENGFEISKEDVKAFIFIFANMIIDSVIEGKTVNIKNLGVFGSYETKPQYRSNPHTGERVFSPKRRVPSFKNATYFKQSLKNASIDFTDDTV